MHPRVGALRRAQTRFQRHLGSGSGNLSEGTVAIKHSHHSQRGAVCDRAHGILIHLGVIADEGGRVGLHLVGCETRASKQPSFASSEADVRHRMRIAHAAGWFTPARVRMVGVVV